MVCGVIEDTSNAPAPVMSAGAMRGAAMEEKAVVTRTEIADHIEGAFGRAVLARGDLLEQAKRTGARPEVVNTIAKLPNDGAYVRLRDLWSHLSEVPV